MKTSGSGKIVVICGGMFSGKTERLIRRMNMAHIARKRTLLFKPALDNRFSETHIVSHSGLSLPAFAVRTVADICAKIDSEAYVDVVGIDEAQFFGDDLIEFVEHLANSYGIHVAISGLDMDYTGAPFGPMPALLCVAEKVIKCKAVCAECGSYRPCRSRRTVPGINQVQLGAGNRYTPLCRSCFYAHRSRDE